MLGDKALRSVEKCKHCGRAKNMHRAGTLDCPRGKRTPIGYSTFGPTCFTPQRSVEKAKKEDAGHPAEPDPDRAS
jgi:hypothetical protein